MRVSRTISYGQLIFEVAQVSFNISLLRTSFERVSPRADRFAAAFFERLYRDDPEAREIFADLPAEDQRRQLVQTLIVLLKLLDQPAQLRVFLADLAQRLRLSQSDHALLEILGQTLRETLAEFHVGIWTPELARNWEAVIQHVCLELLHQAPLHQQNKQVTSNSNNRSTSQHFESHSTIGDINSTGSNNNAENEHNNPPKKTADQIGEAEKISSASECSDFQSSQSGEEITPPPEYLAAQEVEAFELEEHLDQLYEDLLNRQAVADSSLQSKYSTISPSGVAGDIPAKDNGSFSPSRKSRTFHETHPNGFRAATEQQTLEHSFSPTPVKQEQPVMSPQSPAIPEVASQADSDLQSSQAAIYFNMIEAMPINVLLAGRDLKITYLNKASERRLRELSAHLPIPVEKMVGQSIDIFHKDPQHQRRLLADPANLPHRAQIQVGPETLDLLVSAVHDAEQQLSGYMLTWDIVTETVRLEREMTRIKHMMENIPLNILYANTDLELVYMNATSRKTLKAIEHLLPLPIDNLIGQKIDIFHKEPEQQRQFLRNPDNLPHRAKIRLGEHHMSLLVSAVRDSSGNYVGPMLTWELITERIKIADNLESELKGIVQVISSSATELEASAQGMATIAGQTTRQSQIVAGSSEEVTKNVQTVASSAEELSASIAEIAHHVQEASKMTARAVQEADRTNITIRELSESSEEIGQVIKVITSIAQQTNLLALNATIEAARAGEAGKGFAVVANEVKELARQTAKATEEIREKISAIQSATGGAATAITSIGESISRINEISTTIAGAVEEQTAATNEISRNVAEAATATAEVSMNIVQVTSAASESGVAANDILTASAGLARESETLNSLANNFVERLRSMT